MSHLAPRPPHRFRLRRYGRRIFWPNNFSAEKFWAEFFSPIFFFDRFFFGRKIFARIFSWGGLGGRSRSNHFKKFAKANFLKWCRGGVWGGLPPQETPLPVPCPQGGSGGLRPPGISVNYPCLASAAAVPCPRALPPVFLVRICSSEFFREDGSDFDDFWTV